MPDPRMLKRQDHGRLIRKLVHFVVGKAALLGRATDPQRPSNSTETRPSTARDVLPASPYIVVALPNDVHEANRWAVRHYAFAAPIAEQLSPGQAKTLCSLLNATNKFSIPNPAATSNDRTAGRQGSAF